MKRKSFFSIAAALIFAPVGFAPVHAKVDAAAAKALMKSNNCTICHSAERSKAGPSLKSISAKYKGKADGEQTVIRNMTTVYKVKLGDGSEGEHAVVKTTDAEQLKNLARWILSH